MNVRSGMQVSRRRCVRCIGSGIKDLGVKDGSRRQQQQQQQECEDADLDCFRAASANGQFVEK